jgi:hypothetical protein
MAELATSSGGGFEDGLVIKFVADLSQIRQALEQLKSEAASQSVSVSVRGGAAALAGSSSAGAVGLLPAGDEPVGLIREDQRREQRLIGAGASSNRVERLIDRDDSGGALSVVARRRDTATGYAPSGWGGYAGWGGGAGAPPWMPYAGGAMVPGAAGGGAGGGGWTWGGGGAGGGMGPPIGPGGYPLNIPNAPQPGPVPPGGGGGGGAPWMRFSAGGLSRYFTAGFMLSEAGRLGQAAQRYQTDTTLAGSNQSALYEAEQQLQAGVTGTPIIGRLAGVAAEAITGDGQAGEVAMAGAKATDAYTRAVLSGARLRKSLYYDSAEATAPDEYELRKVQIAAKYDPLINNAADKARTEEISAAAVKRDADLAAIRTKYKLSDPDELTGGGGYSPEEIEADERMRQSMRGEIAGVNKGYSNTESKIIERYKVSASLRADAQAAETAKNEREHTAAMAGLTGRTAAARLRAGGYEDAGSLAAFDAQQDAERLKFDQKSGDYGAFVASLAADRLAFTNSQSGNAYLRGSEYSTMFATGLAVANADPYGGGFAKLNQQFTSTVVGAQTQDLPAALAAAASQWIGGSIALRRGIRGQEMAAGAEATASGYAAIGDRFGEARANVSSTLAQQLNAGGTPAQQEAYRATARNREAVIDRSERLFGAQLRDNVSVSDAIAQGTEPGGYRRTAQVRDALFDTRRAVDSDPDPGRQSDILRLGINRLRSLQRDFGAAGRGAEVESGTIGPGSGVSGDRQQAERELVDAIRELTRKLGVTGESFTGGAGTSSGGEF